jgi:hypothetical protein
MINILSHDTQKNEMLKTDKTSQSQTSVLPYFRDAWLRATDCSIEGEEIVAKGHVIWHSPASVKDLTGEFASIEDVIGAVRFVTEYGPLELPEGASRVRLLAGVNVLEWRVPIESVLVQAKRVARMRKAAALFNDTRSKVQKKLASTLAELWGLRAPWTAEPKKAVAEHLSAAQVKHKVSEFILQELNKHLPRSHEFAHINVRGEFEDVLAFEDLLAVIYRKLFEELKRGRLRLCQECGTVFEWTDSRQMYCGKRCGLNLAQRRHRERQRKGTRKQK